MSTTIAIVRHTDAITDDDASALASAMQTQVSRDFQPLHGPYAVVTFFAGDETLPDDAWVLALLDDSDQAEALAYHDLTQFGLPLGKSFVKTTKDAGGIWTVPPSHELLEMLADPFLNKCATVDGPDGLRLYAYEVCDGPEGDVFAYDVDGVMLTDFVTPEWFDPLTDAAAVTSYAGNLRGPLTLGPGGYIGINDVVSAQGWTQITGDVPGARARAGMFGLPPHSRRERRARPRNAWRRSGRHGGRS